MVVMEMKDLVWLPRHADIEVALKRKGALPPWPGVGVFG
jgi:hypothetical protein